MYVNHIDGKFKKYIGKYLNNRNIRLNLEVN